MQRVLFLGQGRLGNQIFQWVALNRVFPGAAITAPNMGSLARVIETDGRLQIDLDSALRRRLARRKGGRALVRLAYRWLHAGGYAHEPATDLPDGQAMPSGRMVVARPDSPRVFVDGGYYQNLRSFLQPRDFQAVRVRADLLGRTQAALRACIGAGRWPDFVVHVRRTDYLQYHPFGLTDVTLRAPYYLQAAAHLREQIGSAATALVITDDPAWCRESLQGLGAFQVFSDREDIDFAALTQFPGLVIANSSYSLAAACIGPRVERIVAPRHWFGANVGAWYPPQIESIDPRFVYL